MAVKKYFSYLSKNQGGDTTAGSIVSEFPQFLSLGSTIHVSAENSYSRFRPQPVLLCGKIKFWWNNQLHSSLTVTNINKSTMPKAALSIRPRNNEFL